ncbi:hypothetical protein CIB84_012787 [Bambusicola thoracicus]|uniref:Uncharacterized protein n=1 Tax=Bambusicola thoracicus TaxID=9083 RepID=A0A2P4SH95_BAMTH|nr:hypothetical protein CIB84_012787 [Bambusicola thoracicus]
MLLEMAKMTSVFHLHLDKIRDHHSLLL